MSTSHTYVFFSKLDKHFAFWNPSNQVFLGIVQGFYLLDNSPVKTMNPHMCRNSCPSRNKTTYLPVTGWSHDISRVSPGPSCKLCCHCDIVTHVNVFVLNIN